MHMYILAKILGLKLNQIELKYLYGAFNLIVGHLLNIMNEISFRILSKYLENIYLIFGEHLLNIMNYNFKY